MTNLTDLTVARDPLHLEDAEAITIPGDEAQSVLAGIDGVLDLLERQSETSENTFNAFCLLCLVRGQLEGVLREAR